MFSQQIEDARHFFEEDSFLLDFYNTAIECYEKSDSSLKINNFACNMRELLREKMALVAPDEKVSQCEWCKGNKYLDNNKPTRRARIRYYLLSNMPDASVGKIFKEKIEEIESKYAEQIKQLSIYTHITKSIFYSNTTERDSKFFEILNLLTDILGFIETSKQMTNQEIEKFLYDDITNHIYNDYIDSELDLLSNHTRIDDVSGIEYEIEEITNDYIFITGTADLDVDLQYGSYSEMKRGDGEIVTMNFDLDFSVKINLLNFEDKEYMYEPVNTDKFFENE